MYKKTLLTALLILLIITIASCSADNKKSDMSTEALTTTKEPVPVITSKISPAISELPSLNTSTPTSVNNEQPKPTYELIKDGDKTLVKIEGLPSALQTDMTYLYFDSLSHMRESLIKGDFTDKQLETIKKEILNNGEKDYLPFDIDEIYEPITPEGYEDHSVIWDKYGYSVIVSRLEPNSKEVADYIAMIFYHNNEEYQKTFEKWYTDFLEFPNITEIYYEKQVEDRNAVVNEHQASHSRNRLIRYTLEKDGIVYTVSEIYCINNSAFPELNNEKVPFTVNVFFEVGEVGVRMNFSELRERPSVEFITSFSAKVFEDSESKVTE